MRELTSATRRSIIFTVGLLSVFCKILPARKKKATPEPTAIIAGTVFRGVGFSFPGVDVAVVNMAGHRKIGRGITGARGEFLIHVPSGEAIYLVTAKKKGFQTLKREIEIYGMERVTINFRMVEHEKHRK